ncbi:FAD-binding oxidoreductase [Tropicibacter sp. R16_0]|uniref:NAD(P)/FAD-dependent oxidoreductase n=1 Tax=Tropicibacter sp. R16_0 TaxID=2821102 RepID=UPI001ADA9D9F|nr:FAD-binding oxidoreductase [Tropicibacter sp. R16_0]MBO9450760.1 FAD-binding oxidoreductase [Tropicibacter sp. R16_0]
MTSENTQNLWHQTCAEQVAAPVLSGDVTVDLVVIGGGYTGCSAALHAAEMGASVCLLEAEEIGHGGSGRNVGLANAGLWLPPAEIRKHLGDGPGDRLVSLLADAPRLVFELIARHGIECEAVQNGTLHCAHSPAGFKDLQVRHAQLKSSGAPVDLLDADATAARTGSNTFYGALFDPRAGTIQPLGYARGLARAAVQARAQVYQNSPARRIQHDGDVWRVETAGGTVRAKALIQATNAYHRNLAPSAPEYVPVHYFQCATDPLPEALRATILPGGEGCWDTGLIMTSFRMDQAGRLVIGAMGDLGHAASGIHRAWVRRKLIELYPDLRDVPLSQGWHGRIAMTSDHIPKITAIGPNAYAVHGYSGRGIGPGTVFGKGMAEALITGDDARLPIPAIEAHHERMTGARQVFFETGATLTHLIKARF